MNKFFLVVAFFTSLVLISLDKKSIYDALSSEKESVIKQQIASLKKQSSADARAFRAVFTMKSAQFEFAPWSKLSVFNAGKALLEKEITTSSSNVEYRFLRLMIQENAPAIVMYSSNITADSKLIKAGYTKLNSDTKDFILKYSKKSTALKGLGN